jgi:hypothetical protein
LLIKKKIKVIIDCDGLIRLSANLPENDKFNHKWMNGISNDSDKSNLCHLQRL